MDLQTKGDKNMQRDKYITLQIGYFQMKNQQLTIFSIRIICSLIKWAVEIFLGLLAILNIYSKLFLNILGIIVSGLYVLRSQILITSP
jgi:hypothetical protein